MVRVLLAATWILVAGTSQAAPGAKVPSFDAVTKAVETSLAAQPDYRNGDLLSQSKIETVLKSIAAAGWKVDNQAEIVALALPDDSFLVRELSSPRGKKFMRKIAAHPGGYSHLDRLSTIPSGEKTVRYLISKPGGDDMITYMATTPGGHKLSQMMGGIRGGVNLNKPTNRIYTASDLLAVLQQLHKAAVK